MPTFQEIAAELHNLNKEELKDLKGRISTLLGTNGGNRNTKPKEILDKDVKYFKQIIILQAKKYVGVPSDFVLGTDKFNLDTYLNTIAKELKTIINDLKFNKTESVKLCRVLVESALAKIEETGKPKSFRILVYMMSDPRSLFDESWPGYFGSDLFKGIVLK
jgi:hypothetical protein